VKTVTIITALICCLIISSVSGQDRITIGGLNGLDPHDDRERYSISLALSGGGARGLAVIGILKAFEEKCIDVVAITGTSIGGIIGGLYAAGYGPDELTSLVHNMAFDQLLTNTPSRKSMFLTQREERGRHLFSIRFHGFVPVIPQGLTAGQRLTSLLTNLTTKANYHCNNDFSKLAIPFKTISTDIITGREVIHGRGSLAEAMRATMGFPLAFTGLEKNGQLLMDGGMVTPIPVELVRKMSDSVSFVVAVNTTSQLLPRDELVTPVDIANQVTSIMTSDKLSTQLQAADFVITPPIDSFSSTDFKCKDALIDIGYQSGGIAADSIIKLLHQQQRLLKYKITQVEVDISTQAAGDTIRAKFLEKTFNRAQLVTMLKSLAIDLNLFWLQAELESLDLSPDGAKEVLLRITAYPCFQFSDIKFIFVGNTIYDDAMLAAQFVFESPVLTPRRLQQGLDRILDLYDTDGFNLTGIREVAIGLYVLIFP